MIDKINSKASFSGRAQLPVNIKQVKRVFYSEFKDIKSPSRLEMLSLDKLNELNIDLQELKNRLAFLRKFSKTFYQDGGIPEVFRGLLGCVKAFKVANCAEYAEIGKTICKMNGINNCDIFTLHAKAPNGEIRTLDHTIIAFKVPKSKNSPITKRNGYEFVPMQDVRILDLWLDGFSGTVRQAKDKYKILGLNSSDTLLFKPENTFEPNLETINLLRENFPNLFFKK